MNCKKYQRLLHLNREGERSANEILDLNKHLQTCKTCAVEYENINQADSSLLKIKMHRLVLTNPDEIADNILTTITQTQTNSPKYLFSIDFIRVAAVLSSARIQIACASFVVIAVGIFLLEYISIFYHVENLERKFSQASTVTTEQEISYSIGSDQLKDVTEQNKLQSLYKYLEIYPIRDQVTIMKSTLTSLLDYFETSKAIRTDIGTTVDINTESIQRIFNRLIKNGTITIHFGLQGA